MASEPEGQESEGVRAASLQGVGGACRASRAASCGTGSAHTAANTERAHDRQVDGGRRNRGNDCRRVGHAGGIEARMLSPMLLRSAVLLVALLGVAGGQDVSCAGLEPTAALVSAGHDCLGCEWIHVAGAVQDPRVNGLYQRVDESSAMRATSAAAKFRWFYGGQNLNIMWQEAFRSWVITGQNASEGVLYRAQDNASNPVLIAPRDGGGGIWESRRQASFVAEKTLRVQCVATPKDFTMRAGVRELVSFGFNFYGELGRTANVLTLEPVSTPGVVDKFGSTGEAGVVEQLAVGCNHGLALTRDGNVWAWGSNAKGQLGSFENAGMSRPNAEPKKVSLAGPASIASFFVERIVSGGTFSMAVTRFYADGSTGLLAAGSNRYGQLGRSENHNQEIFNPEFRSVNGLTGIQIVDAAAGRHHALLLNANATLYAWGNNRYGQLGQTRGMRTDDANFEPKPVLSNFINSEGALETPFLLALGRFHSVVVTREGSAFCFGSNLRGQCGPALGNPVSFQPGSDEPNPDPRQLEPALLGNQRVVAVAAGEYSTVLHTADGKLWGFGRNFYGHLTSIAGGVGYGTPISTPKHVDVSDLRNSSGVARFAVGGDHTILVFSDDGYGGSPDIVALGSNVYGQLGTAEHVGGAIDTKSVFAPSKASLGCSAVARANGTGQCSSGYMRAIHVSAACDQTVLVTERPQCPAGTNSSDSGLQPCSVCPSGTFQPEAGSSTCLACAQGKFSYAGSIDCLVCANGTNSSSDRTNETGCLRICHPGEYGVQQHVGKLGLAPCSQCGFDMYSDDYGATQCRSCPEGSGSTSVGLISQGQCRWHCSPGFISSDGLGGTLGTDCNSTCSSNCTQRCLSSSQSGSEYSLCIDRCSAHVGGACQACAPGTHQSSSRSTMCLGCPAGKYSLSGSSVCTDCARGSYSNQSNASSCILCDYGTYQESVGQTACEVCRADKSTTFAGAANESDCKVTVFQVWGVGNNLWGQLGTGWLQPSVGTEKINHHPYQVANDVGNPGRGLDNEQVQAVSAGYSHTLFLTTGRHVWAAGQNIYGQLGKSPSAPSACSYADGPDLVCLEDPQPNAIPNYVSESHFEGRQITKVAAGRHSSVALTADGRLYTWGYNRYGQLGRSTNAGTDLPNWKPQQVNLTSLETRTVKDVAVGSYHVLLLAHDQTVFTFGLNRNGQLGSQRNAGQWYANWAPRQIKPEAFRNQAGQIPAVIGLAAGALHSLVMTEDGNVWAFGSNAWGQLGSPMQAFVWGGLLSTPTKVMSGAVQVAAGGKHSVVRTAHGELYGFGSNYYGQLATRTAVGDRIARPVPLTAPVFDGWQLVQVAAGGDNTIVQGANGSQHVLWLVGSNRYGQLAVHQNAGEYTFNPDPLRVSTCDLMQPEYCHLYTVISVSVGASFAMIQTGADVCPRGTKGPAPYGRPGTASSCEKCPAGTFASASGSVECVECGKGRYAPPGSSACYQCAHGSYADVVKAAACTACPSGKTMAAVTNRSSAAECLQICPPGSAASQESLQTPLGSAGWCQVCPAGKFNNVTGALACSACPRASYSAANSSGCTACPAGFTTWPSGGTAPSDCGALCPAGKFSLSGGDAPGTGSCSVSCASNCTVNCVALAPSGAQFSDCVNQCNGDCDSGCSSNCTRDCVASAQSATQFSECIDRCNGGGDSGRCEACATGTYSDFSGATACQSCPEGSSTYGPGQTGCEGECQSGSFSSTNGLQPCTSCPSGTYALVAGSTTCATCSPGSFSSHGASSCTLCAPGSSAVYPGSAGCTACGAGFFQRHHGQSTCHMCPSGYFTDVDNSTSCKQCAPGFTTNGSAGAHTCFACPAGKTLVGANSSAGCKYCSPGSFAGPGASNCSLCAPGSYAVESGSASCTPCAIGTTQRSGANSSSECVSFTDSFVTLSLPLADAVSALDLAFVPHMSLLPDDDVWLGLPGFALAEGAPDDGSPTPIAITGSSSSSFKAFWEPATEQRPFESLRLHVVNAVPSLTPVSLFVAGILRVPALGLRRCETLPGVPEGGDVGKKCVSLSTNAATGAVLSPVPVEKAPVVGSFGASSTVQWSVFPFLLSGAPCPTPFSKPSVSPSRYLLPYSYSCSARLTFPLICVHQARAGGSRHSDDSDDGAQWRRRHFALAPAVYEFQHKQRVAGPRGAFGGRLQCLHGAVE